MAGGLRHRHAQPGEDQKQGVRSCKRFRKRRAEGETLNACVCSFRQMRVAKGGDPSIGVGSYVLVGLCMQLGQNLHMQAREPGLGGEEMFFGEAKERVQFFVSGGESNHEKRSLLEVPSMGDRLTKAGCGYVCQSHIKKAS